MLKRLIGAAAVLIVTSSMADTSVSIQVLGVAQDAGYPQLNCYQPHCIRAWENKDLRRTTSSIAIIDRQAKIKLLFDATPDIRDQLYRLNLTAPDIEYALQGVFLTHAHMGHYTGLMHFGREASGSKNVPVYAMPRMYEFLATNGPWDQLVRYENIELIRLTNDKPVVFSNQLRVTPFRVPHRDEYSETIGYRIDGPGKSAVFIPDIDKWDRWETDIRDIVRSVDYAFLDATFFADTEMPGRDMSQIPHPFVAETMDLFDGLTSAEKSRVIFIHMNHSNPLLVDGSQEQTEVEKRGFRFAREGMRLEL